MKPIILSNSTSATNPIYGIFLLSIIMLTLSAGCSDSGSDPVSSDGGGTTVDTLHYTSDILPIIQNSGCLQSSCHGGSTAGGLILASGSYSTIINASGDNGSFVTAGNSAGSNFFIKISPNPPFGSRMPLNGTVLSTTDINKVKDWIDKGAIE